jgi:hypothetical protein
VSTNSLSRRQIGYRSNSSRSAQQTPAPLYRAWNPPSPTTSTPCVSLQFPACHPFLTSAPAPQPSLAEYSSAGDYTPDCGHRTRHGRLALGCEPYAITLAGRMGENSMTLNQLLSDIPLTSFRTTSRRALQLDYIPCPLPSPVMYSSLS